MFGCSPAGHPPSMVSLISSRRISKMGWPTPPPELIVRDEQPRLAPTARQPVGLSPPCSLFTRARICSGPRNSSPPLDPPPAPPDEEWRRQFAGLHHAALTAPGPTGSCPEHITDLLNVPRKVHAHEVHAALAVPFSGLPTSCHVAHAHSALLAAAHQDG